MFATNYAISWNYVQLPEIIHLYLSLLVNDHSVYVSHDNNTNIVN